MPTHKVTDEIITAAIDGFESQKTRIDAQIEELRAMLSGGSAQGATPPEVAPRKRRVSAAARRRMALGQKRRWATIKAISEPSEATPEPPKPKRRISEEGMKRIIAATKKRWRLAKAAKAQPATAKKVAVKKAAPAKAAKKRAANRTATASAETPGNQ